VSSGERAARFGGRGRLVAFLAICTICLVAAIVFVVHSPSTGTSEVDEGATGTTPATVPLATVTTAPHLVFRDTRLGDDFGKVALVDLAKPDGPIAVTDLSCERVDFRVDRGICLAANRGAVTSYATVIFDEHFKPLFTSALAGLPSRVRVSPDGHYGATTTFVAGDSYTDHTFSTRTELLDLHSGASLGSLEQFKVIKDGQPFESVDFNFWGVTFANDNNTFYATLGTGGHTYLVKGDLAARQVVVLRDGVECPSLSPDNTRIAYKKRVPSADGRIAWRLAVLDVATLADHDLAETRNLDDQANWLDDGHVLYALPEADAGTPTDDTWSVPADGTGTPTRVLPGAWSAGVVR
jgi:hypothetical protein